MTNDILSDSLNVPSTLGITLDTPVHMVNVNGNSIPGKITKITKKEITVSVRADRELTFVWSYRDRAWYSNSNVFAPLQLALGPCPLKK